MEWREPEPSVAIGKGSCQFMIADYKNGNLPYEYILMILKISLFKKAITNLEYMDMVDDLNKTKEDLELRCVYPKED